MNRWCWLLSGAVLMLGAVAAPADTAGDGGLRSLSATFKTLLIGAMPPVLYEKDIDWGRQALTPSGLEWRGIRPRITRALRNDGQWRKLRVTGEDLQRTLELRLYDLRQVAHDRETFKVFLAFQAGVHYEQQNWEHGVRHLSSSAEARLRVKLDLECEKQLRIEAQGLLPDFVFRLRVVKAQMSYDNLVVEHIAGIGGSGARLLGEAVRSSLKQWKPSLERELLNRAGAAIVRAGDTREVRLGVAGIVR
jgi:hypothetical protein